MYHHQSRTKLFFSLMVLGFVIAILHFIASMYYLYFEWWWFDIMMHVFGGIFIAGSALWFLKYEVPARFQRRVPPFLFAFVSIAVIGVMWEWFELLTGMYSAVNYTLDTTLDLLSDVAGMLIAYTIFSRYET